MNAINSSKILGFDSFCSVTNIKIKTPISSLSCSQLFRPNFGPRLRISYGRNKTLEQCLSVPRISFLLEDSNEEYPKTEQSSSSKNSHKEAAIDLKLPRRSLLVAFTCDACGERSQRLINRLAYERGLVYVQPLPICRNCTKQSVLQCSCPSFGQCCSGCSQYHKLVDNLGLVIEYNLQEGTDSDANTDGSLERISN